MMADTAPTTPAIPREARVLVTQAASRNGYVVAYSLGIRGVRVIGADTVRIAPARLSRYCSSYHRYPGPREDPEGYFRTIGAIVERERIDLIIPAYDEAYFLAEHRDRLPRPGLVLLPDHPTIHALHNKASFYALCRELGCRVPETCELKGMADVEAAIERLGFPLVLKPERGGGGWGISFPSSRPEMLDLFHDFDANLHRNRLMAQRFIPGDQHGLGVICLDGEVLATNAYRVVRQHPIGKGTSCYRLGVRHEQAEEYARKIFGRLRWTGVCEIDYIEAGDGQGPCLIDANPRIWAGTAQALASGIDFPYLLSLIAAGRADDARALAKDGSPGIGIATSWLWGDLLVLCRRLLRGPGRWAALGEHLRDWRRARFDDFRREDPLPFLLYPVRKLADLFMRRRDGGF